MTALTYRKISKRHGGAVQGLRFWIATPTPVGLRAKAKALALGLCRGRGPPNALGLGPWAAAAGQAQGQGLGLRANRRGGGCQKRESEVGARASLTKGVPRRRRPRTGIPRRRALPLFLRSALEVVAAMAPPAVSAKGEAPASVAVEAVDVKCEAVDGQAAASGAAAASS